jgi:hypothetical protein
MKYFRIQGGVRITLTSAPKVHMTDGTTKQLLLDDYLALPAPRTTQHELAKAKVAQQHGLAVWDGLEQFGAA